MQENPEYVSNWQPKILEKAEPVTVTQTTQEAAPQLPYTLSYGTPEKRTEYTVSSQHNGYEMDGHVLRRVYFDNQVGSIAQSLYTDGQWHTTATLPPGVQIMQFKNVGMALQTAREDAAQNGLKELLTTESIASQQYLSNGENGVIHPKFRHNI